MFAAPEEVQWHKKTTSQVSMQTDRGDAEDAGPETGRGG